MSAWAPYVDWSARLSGEGTISNPLLVEAFERVRRYDFLPPESKPRNAADRPLGIGHGQTNSQPSTVGMMLELLDIQPGQKILDVGAGSGWTTALLAHAVGKKGVVHATERIPELVKMAKDNIGQYDYPNAIVHRTPRRLGLRSEAPYDRILVSAAVKQKWAMDLFKRQLSSEGGVMVVPVADDETHGNDKFDKTIIALRKHDDDRAIPIKKVKGYSFVPLVLPEAEPVAEAA